MTALATRQAQSPRGRLIAVASGKGGVGKTWFSITLAHALARAGRRVLLFDGDIGLANVDIQLGLLPRLDLGSVLAGYATLADIRIPHQAGFDILPGRSGSGALAALLPDALNSVIHALTQQATHYDMVILDLGSGIETTPRRLAAAADTLLVIATEDPTSLTDAYAVLKLHAQDNPTGDARIIVNQTASPTAGTRVFNSLSRACDRFLNKSPIFAGTIRRDPQIRDSIRHQTPHLQRHPTSNAATDVEAIAAALGI